MYSYFPSKLIKLSSSDRDCTAHKVSNIYPLVLYRESLLPPDLGAWKECEQGGLAVVICTRTWQCSFDPDFLASEVYALLAIASSQSQREPLILCFCPFALFLAQLNPPHFLSPHLDITRLLRTYPLIPKRWRDLTLFARSLSSYPCPSTKHHLVCILSNLHFAHFYKPVLGM